MKFLKTNLTDFLIFVRKPCFYMTMCSLKETRVKALVSFFSNKSYGFLNFYVDTLFLNEHAQLKKWFKFKKILL